MTQFDSIRARAVPRTVAWRAHVTHGARILSSDWAADAKAGPLLADTLSPCLALARWQLLGPCVKSTQEVLIEAKELIYNCPLANCQATFLVNCQKKTLENYYQILFFSLIDNIFGVHPSLVKCITWVLLNSQSRKRIPLTGQVDERQKFQNSFKLFYFELLNSFASLN